MDGRPEWFRAARDLVVLYATGRLQRYMAIARVCHRPTQNDKVRRRRADREWWTYLQVQPLERTVPRAEVEAQRIARVERSGVGTPTGSRSNRIAPAIADELLDFLVSGDGRASATLKSWRRGTGAWARHLDAAELRWAEWTPPDRKT